ncbi:MAG TPA: hypothetical protein VM050_05430 [Patescibacteria group bacterium]|nr:hypothetical protein [Patescibacteria group bacterium]
MFRSTPKKTDLLDQLDLEIEEHRRVSSALRKEYLKFRQEASELMEEGLEGVAKGRLKSALYVRKLRENKENMITNLQTTRLQLSVSTDRTTHRTLENVSVLLRQSRVDRERTEMEFGSIFTDIEMEMEEEGAETFGMESSTLDDEFEKLKQELGMAKTKEPVQEEPKKVGFPELPSVPKAAEPEEKEPTEKEKEEKLREG